ADPPCLPVPPVIKTLRLLPAMIFETLPYKRFSLPLRLGNSAGRHPRCQCEICLAAKIRGVLSREVFERCRFLPGDIRDRRCNTVLLALPTESELFRLAFCKPGGRSGIQDCLLRASNGTSTYETFLPMAAESLSATSKYVNASGPVMTYF